MRDVSHFCRRPWSGTRSRDADVRFVDPYDILRCATTSFQKHSSLSRCRCCVGHECRHAAILLSEERLCCCGPAIFRRELKCAGAGTNAWECCRESCDGGSDVEGNAPNLSAQGCPMRSVGNADLSSVMVSFGQWPSVLPGKTHRRVPITMFGGCRYNSTNIVLSQYLFEYLNIIIVRRSGTITAVVVPDRLSCFPTSFRP